jgi:hypothetical protein
VLHLGWRGIIGGIVAIIKEPFPNLIAPTQKRLLDRESADAVLSIA